jgi:hypothetical protein
MLQSGPRIRREIEPEGRMSLREYFEECPLDRIECLYNFAYLPEDKIERLAHAALKEQWGRGNKVLKRYLALHVGLAVRQGKFVQQDGGLIFCAGHLQTRYGNPLYLRFEENKQLKPAYYLQYVGEALNSWEQLPQPPEYPSWPQISPGAEIILAGEHILNDHSERLGALSEISPIAGVCALTGAIHWALFRDLAVKQLHYGVPSYFVPIYLESRDDITRAPDLIAPLQVQENKLYVRTALEPYMAYPSARIVSTRHDKLPSWLLRAWEENALVQEESNYYDDDEDQDD